MIIAGVLVMVAMAYAEGANDVSKVVATLVGSRVTNYRRAIMFGAVCTAIGSGVAIVWAARIVATLTTDLLTPGPPVHPTFAISALLGASAWVLFATRAAVPVSSSHAIIGSILFLGAFVLGPERVRWDAVTTRVVLPLAVSPLMAVPLAIVLHMAARRLSERWLVVSHWISAGLASFARGVNDAPKIVALGAFFYVTGDGLATAPLPLLFGIVALGMTAGSLIAGWRVTETLATRVTTIDHPQGLAANASTALIVIAASRFGLPASTTHVISTSLIGTAMKKDRRAVQWRTVTRLAAAWLMTLPASGTLAALSYLLLDSWL
jgi:inorganic phosphate transporter, PiT family